eukprot:810413-Alexandrium_andersonii.AAC.1
MLPSSELHCSPVGLPEWGFVSATSMLSELHLYQGCITSAPSCLSESVWKTVPPGLQRASGFYSDVPCMRSGSPSPT